MTEGNRVDLVVAILARCRFIRLEIDLELGRAPTDNTILIIMGNRSVLFQPQHQVPAHTTNTNRQAFCEIGLFYGIYRMYNLVIATI